MNSWSGIGEPKKAQVQENSNRPLEHTPDPHPPVYEGNPSIFIHIYILAYLGNVPGVCWNFLRLIKPRRWTHESRCTLLELGVMELWSQGAYWSPLGQTIPPWELTYPHPRYVWRWVSELPVWWDMLVPWRVRWISQGRYKKTENVDHIGMRIAPGCDRLVTTRMTTQSHKF